MRSRLYILIALLLLTSLNGCINTDNKVNWAITLDSKDKGPYGTYLAHQSLKYFFPKASIAVLPPAFRYSNMDNKMKYNFEQHNLLILQGLDFKLAPKEWDELKQFVENGNELVIFCSVLDTLIEQELDCYKRYQLDENYDDGIFNIEGENAGILSINNNPGKVYGYAGHSLKGYFSGKTEPSSDTSSGYFYDSSKIMNNEDSSIAHYIKAKVDSAAFNIDEETEDSTDSDYEPIPCDTLGYALQKPNIVRYTLGDGHITLHAAPLALSNYFLLQPGNEYYLTAIWQTLPHNINRVYWNDYMKRHAEDSDLGILLRHSATKMALWLAVIAMIVYIVFEGKRKQRIIPIIPPLKNDSVSFVETVGRLYFNKGNHTNLAEKMSLQFMEWVRTRYYLNTNILNEQFIHQLTVKSGERETTVRALIEMIQEIRTGAPKIDDAYLYQLYNTIQQFYKNDHR